MSIKRVKIDTWDGGIINSDRSVNFTDGASIVKNFDIYSDNKKLKPLPSFEPWSTQAENYYELTALDYDANTVGEDNIFATGRYIKNWLSPNFPYRIPITPNTANVVGQSAQMGIDLSRLSSDFWDNVTISGQYADVAVSVVANGAHKPIPFDTVALDETAQTGWLFFNYQAPGYTGVDNTSTIYLYFGSSTMDNGNRNYTQSLGQRSAYEADAVYHFDNIGTDAQNVTPRTPSYPDTAELQLTEATAYEDLEYLDIDGVTDGVIGTWVHSGDASTKTVRSDGDNAANDYPGGDNQLAVSGSVYITAYPSATTSIFNIGNNSFIVKITNTGTVQCAADGDGTGVTTISSAAPLSLNTWYRIHCEYQDDSHFNMWINGTLSVAGAAPSVDLEPYTLPAVRMEIPSGVYLQNFIGSALVAEDGSLALQDYKILKENENCYTIGTLEEYADITPSFTGMTIYTKALSGTEWVQEKLTASIPLQIDSNSPLDDGSNSITAQTPALFPTFIAYDGSSVRGKKFCLMFINDTQDNINDGTRYIMLINSETQALPANGIALTDFIGSFSDAGIIPNGVFGIDGDFYFSTPGSTVYNYIGTDPTTGFSAFPTVSSIDNYSGYLAMGGFKDNRSYAQLWDRSSSVANQFIDFGIGWLKVLATVKGNLIAVVDGFIDNSAKSVSKPYIEVRRWTGGTTYDTPARIELPANYTTGFDEEYLSPVYNKRISSKNAVLFYAKIPTDETLATFHEGFWGVGVNERTNKLSFSLVYDTSGFGKILDYTSVGNNVIFTNEKHEAYKLSSGTYTQPSVYETLKFEGDFISTKKKLHAIGLSTEELDTNQKITLSYKRTSDTSWTTIGTMTSANSTNGVFKEFINTPTTSLPEFRSIQFRLESKNGSASILELSLRYEDLTTKE
jgi:hypothetical protein